MSEERENSIEYALARLTAIESLFETDGWREIIRELEQTVEGLRHQALASESIEELKFVQGRADQCLQFIHMETIVNSLKGELLEAYDADV